MHSNHKIASVCSRMDKIVQEEEISNVEGNKKKSSLFSVLQSPNLFCCGNV